MKLKGIQRELYLAGWQAACAKLGVNIVEPIEMLYPGATWLVLQCLAAHIEKNYIKKKANNRRGENK